MAPKSLLVEVTTHDLVDLDALNAAATHPFELEHETSIEAALRWLDAPYVTAFVVDDSVGQRGAVALFQRLQEIRATVPFVYVPLDPPVLSNFGPVLPDVILRRPVNHTVLAARIGELLRFSAFSDAMIEVTTNCVLTTVARSFISDAQLHDLRFRASQVPLHEINATIPLCGEGISGHLSVSADADTLGRLYRRMVPHKPSPSPRMLEDLVGEVSNQLLGALKQVLTGGGIHFALGVPMMYTGSSCPVRYRSSSGSLMLQIRALGSTEEMAVDLALDSMHQDYVPVEDNLAPENGELAFL